MVIRLKQSLNVLRAALFHSRNEDFLHVAADGLQHGGLVGEFVVLGRDDDAVDAFGSVAFRVLYGNLRLGIGTQVFHLLAFLADGGEFLNETVCQFHGQGHVVVHLVTGVAEHHALVAGALVFQGSAFHTLVDVRRLAVNGGDDAAGLIVELVIAFVVADFFDDSTRHIVHGDIAFGFHFTGADDKSGSNQCFACHFRFRILRQKAIQQRVGDLVADFVRVSFRHGFRCE